MRASVKYNKLMHKPCKTYWTIAPNTFSQENLSFSIRKLFIKSREFQCQTIFLEFMFDVEFYLEHPVVNEIHYLCHDKQNFVLKLSSFYRTFVLSFTMEICVVFGDTKRSQNISKISGYFCLIFC